jgi:hypothetical protein
MATHAYSRTNIPVFWDDQYKYLDYITEEFNDTLSIAKWTTVGYADKFTGAMCDMRRKQPSWNAKFIQHFEDEGWLDIGTSYYRMGTGTVLPVHGDLYKKYVELFNLQGQQTSIRRAIVFLEDWRSGHYIEINGDPIVNWHAGDTFIWTYDTPHMAANIGLSDRYTLQITGHVNAGE